MPTPTSGPTPRRGSPSGVALAEAGVPDSQNIGTSSRPVSMRPSTRNRQPSSRGMVSAATPVINWQWPSRSGRARRGRCIGAEVAGAELEVKLLMASQSSLEMSSRTARALSPRPRRPRRWRPGCRGRTRNDLDRSSTHADRRRASSHRTLSRSLHDRSASHRMATPAARGR